MALAPAAIGDVDVGGRLASRGAREDVGPEELERARREPAAEVEEVWALVVEEPERQLVVPGGKLSAGVRELPGDDRLDPAQPPGLDVAQELQHRGRELEVVND